MPAVQAPIYIGAANTGIPLRGAPFCEKIWRRSLKAILLASAAALALGGCATMAADQPSGIETAAAAQAAPVEAVPALPNNVLLADWTGSYGGVPPWDQVKPELVSEAFQVAIDEQRR